MAALRAMLADGRLRPDGWVRHEASGTWVPAALVPGQPAPPAAVRPADGWEYLWDGVACGPVPLPQLRAMIGAGLLPPTARVRPDDGRTVLTPIHVTAETVPAGLERELAPVADGLSRVLRGRPVRLEILDPRGDPAATVDSGPWSRRE